MQTTQQVIEKAKSGELLGRKHSKIALIGFSIGGITSNSLVDKFPNSVDGVVLIGITWDRPYIYPSFLMGLQAPAKDADPGKWGDLHPFYQTHPTLHKRDFNNFFGDYERGALEADFATRDCDTLGGAVTFTYHLVTAPQYRGPVFLGIGGNDATFCGRKCVGQPYELYNRFPRARTHEVKVYPNTGHAVLYHRTGPTAMKDIQHFLEREVDRK